MGGFYASFDTSREGVSFGWDLGEGDIFNIQNGGFKNEKKYFICHTWDKLEIMIKGFAPLFCLIWILSIKGFIYQILLNLKFWGTLLWVRKNLPHGSLFLNWLKIVCLCVCLFFFVHAVKIFVTKSFRHDWRIRKYFLRNIIILNRNSLFPAVILKS